MLIAMVVGILMTFVGYIFGKASGKKQGAIMMASIVASAIKNNPEGAIDMIREKFNAKN